MTPSSSLSSSFFFLVCVSLSLSLFRPVSVLVSGACTIDANGAPQGTPSQTDALVLYALRWPVLPSSTTNFGSREFSGLAGADQLCNENQPNSGSIGTSWVHVSQPRVALLSASSTNAIDRVIDRTNTEIVNVKGECIAARYLYPGANTLFDGLLLGDLILTDVGDPVPKESTVWTGTNFVGGKYGLSSSQIDPGTDVPSKYCNDWTSSSSVGVSASSLGQIGILDFNSRWIAQIQGQPCNTPRYLYCISQQAAPTQETTQGDPQFVGLQGQEFQVHGIPEEYFALVSHPFFALNSHFTYLASGHCHFNDTACWTHPGTYVDQLGLMLPGYEISVMAGTHDQGARLTVNGKAIHHTHTRTQTGFPYHAQFPLHLDNDTIAAVHNAWLEPTATSTSTSTSTTAEPTSWLADATIQISWITKGHVIIQTPVATVDIHNAEHFFNFQLEFHAPRLLLAGAPLHRVSHSHTKSAHAHAHVAPAEAPHPVYPMHGLVGQTWKNVKYPHGRLYAGEVDDYMLADRRLFSTSFVFNEYQY